MAESNEEIWKSIPGYYPYEASDLGGIRHKNKRAIPARNRPLYRIMKPYPNKWGYLLVTLSLGREKEKRIQVHQLIALTFLGECPSGKEINHIDRDRKNNRLDNLEYLTHQENVDHSKNLGSYRFPRGEDSHASKISNKDAQDIFNRISKGEPQKSLSIEYGITQQSINDLWKGRTWKNLDRSIDYDNG